MLAHQSRSSPALCAGDPNSQWKAFEEQKAAHVNVNLRLSAGVLPEWDTPSASGDAVVAATWENLGPSKIVRDQRIGVASDFWNRYEEDIQLAKDVRACPPSLPPDQTPQAMLLHAEVACLVRRLQQLPTVHRVEPPVPAPGRAQPGRRGALQRDLRHAGAVRATTLVAGAGAGASTPGCAACTFRSSTNVARPLAGTQAGALAGPLAVVEPAAGLTASLSRGRQGMEPNVTLHWFVHPNWFQEMGGFTREENIEVFVDWCRTAFSLFGAPSLPRACFESGTACAAAAARCRASPRRSSHSPTGRPCRQALQALDHLQRTHCCGKLWLDAGQPPARQAAALQGAHGILGALGPAAVRRRTAGRCMGCGSTVACLHVRGRMSHATPAAECVAGGCHPDSAGCATAAQKSGEVLLNLLRSHAAAYRAIMAMPGAPKPRVARGYMHVGTRCEGCRSATPEQL